MMIKKTVSIVVIGIMMLALAACSGDDADTAEIKTSDPVQTETQQQTEGSDIGEAKARAIALKKVPGASESDIVSFERDVEGGYIEYEGEIFYNGVEYEFEISAADGSILSWEIDRD